MGRRSSAAGDTTKCATKDCGHPRAEHALDARVCYHDSAEEGQPTQLTCPCRGFAPDADVAEAAADARASDYNRRLPEDGPTTAEDLRRNKDGSINQADLNAAIETTGDGSGGNAGGGES